MRKFLFKFSKLSKCFKVLKVIKCLFKVIMLLMWEEVREVLLALSQAVTIKAYLNMIPRVVEITMTSRLRDLVMEECYMDMLQDDMTLARHIVFAK